jgi:serine/threonine-protein kinase
LSEWAVPGYTELKQLGSGGFGSVMLARHNATGTAVAIKYLLPKLRQDPEFAAMFRAEAEALGALDDPYVVRLYEYVESAAGAAIVMELIDGVTLWDILSQHGRTTPEAALVVMFGSLLGLAAAHARGVVHRDYKPRNVLVGGSGVSKLTDFGIAARAGTPTVPSGSVAYAPPEQFDGGPATPASDVYAATATFYECLAGRPPFTGTTMEAVIWQHRSADVPMDPVPAALQPVVARGMAKDPRYRPSDAAALAAELRAAALSAYGPDWEQRGRWHLGEAALLLAALWPSAGVPALHATSTELAHLSQGTQPAHGAQAAHHPATQAQLHRWHLRHVLHREHLAHLRAGGTRTATRTAGHLRTATVAVTAAAVIAAGLTVEATSRPPDGPGTQAQPAVAAYPAPLASVSTTVLTNNKPVDGNVYAAYYSPGVLGSYPRQALFNGEIKGAAAGEVVRLYAQQFPYTSAPVPVASMNLDPVGGTARYALSATPVLATRYQVRLLRSATATTPLATSATRTVYVISAYQYSYSSATENCAGTVGNAVCHETISVTVYSAPSAIRTEMAKRKYLYLAYNRASAQGGSPGTVMQLDTSGTASSPELIGDNAYKMTLSYSYSTGGGSEPPSLIGFCTQQTEAQDGIGVPGPPACGSDGISTSDYALWF